MGEQCSFIIGGILLKAQNRVVILNENKTCGMDTEL